MYILAYRNKLMCIKYIYTSWSKAPKLFDIVKVFEPLAALLLARFPIICSDHVIFGKRFVATV